MKIFSATLYPVQNMPLQMICHQNLSFVVRDSVFFGACNNEKKPKNQVNISPQESYLHLYNLCFKNNMSFFEDAKGNDARVNFDLFVKYFEDNIRSVSELCDKDLNSIISDKGIRNFLEYIETIHLFKKDNSFDLLKNALTCTNPDGSKLRQNQKLQLIDMLKGYRIINKTPTELIEMVESGKIDLPSLQKSILKSVLMYVANYSTSEFEKIPKDKLNMWNMKYAYLLSLAVNKKPAEFEKVVTLANRKNDFKSEINSKKNVCGKINIQTKRNFEKCGLNYDKWLSPSDKNNVRLIMNENDIGGLEEVAENIADVVDLLRAVGPIKKIINKNYKQFVNNDKFEFPKNMENNKTELLKFLMKFDNDMIQVWKRAERNLKSQNEELRSQAKVTMKMKEYLSEYLKILQSYKPNQNIDLSIKMWDRVPQKDLFQGNYSSCCIAMGKANGQYMPSYLLNTAFNMVEIIDNKSGDTIGNLLCYYLLNSENKPVLVFDSVEINNTFKENLSNNMLEQIREGLAEYGKNLNAEISEEEIPLYMGLINNDVPVESLETVKLKDVNLLGEMGISTITYSDVFDGAVFKTEMSKDIELKLLKK